MDVFDWGHGLSIDFRICIATASMWAIDQLNHSHESYIRHIIQVSESDDRGHMKRILLPWSSK